MIQLLQAVRGRPYWATPADAPPVCPVRTRTGRALRTGRGRMQVARGPGLASMNNRIAPIIIISAVALLCALYLPNLDGGFIFDDLPAIADNVHVQVTSLHPYEWLNAMLLHSTGPLKRPLAFASFVLNYRLTGLDPFYFKLVNFVLHLLCGLLAWTLGRRLLARLPHRVGVRFAAAAAAAIWLLHPVQLTTVLYVVQRMTSMAALFCLAGMICYVSGRERLARGKPGGAARIATAFLVCTPLAAFSKEKRRLAAPVSVTHRGIFLSRPTRPTAAAPAPRGVCRHGTAACRARRCLAGVAVGRAQPKCLPQLRIRAADASADGDAHPVAVTCG